MFCIWEIQTAEALWLELVFNTEQELLYQGQVGDLVASGGEKSPSVEVLSHSVRGHSAR